jgi:hypothetical protein
MRWWPAETWLGEESLHSQGLFNLNRRYKAVLERSGKPGILALEDSHPTDPSI